MICGREKLYLAESVARYSYLQVRQELGRLSRPKFGDLGGLLIHGLLLLLVRGSQT